jgi:hypothetical protein
MHSCSARWLRHGVAAQLEIESKVFNWRIITSQFQVISTRRCQRGFHAVDQHHPTTLIHHQVVAIVSAVVKNVLSEIQQSRFLVVGSWIRVLNRSLSIYHKLGMFEWYRVLHGSVLCTGMQLRDSKK